MDPIEERLREMEAEIANLARQVMMLAAAIDRYRLAVGHDDSSPDTQDSP